MKCIVESKGVIQLMYFNFLIPPQRQCISYEILFNQINGQQDISDNNFHWFTLYINTSFFFPLENS